MNIQIYGDYDLNNTPKAGLQLAQQYLVALLERLNNLPEIKGQQVRGLGLEPESSLFLSTVFDASPIPSL